MIHRLGSTGQDSFVFLAQHRNAFLYHLIIEYTWILKMQIKYDCACELIQLKP